LLINVREYRRGNKKWTIQRKWQHRVQKRKTNNKNTTQYVGHHFHVGELYANRHK
jgi:hypothetical protein